MQKCSNLTNIRVNNKEKVNMNKSDFTKGSVIKNIIVLAVPMTLAQLINVLYNIVDRIYIGSMPSDDALPIAGLGLSIPFISIIIAFANLAGMGGTPLFSIARGRKDDDEAEKIMGNTFMLLFIFSICITLLLYLFRQPLLYAFGASKDTFPFANDYLSIYIIGSPFVMCSLGMNGFINAQGFGKTGMFTIIIGAICNIVLDPIFIFVFDMGIKGAAWATVLSQGASAIWIILFLTGKQTLLKLRMNYLKLQVKRAKNILALGVSGFVMSLTNSTVQLVCNSMLKIYGGDIYISVMTIINSIREVAFMPVQGITQAAQPIISFNYGAKAYHRVKKAIQFTVISSVIYTTAIWLLLFLFPVAFIRIFSRDMNLIDTAVPSMHIYFFGIFLMSLQLSGQMTFLALGKSKQAIFFSIFRKIIIVTPLTLILPTISGLGTSGVFLSEPISNLIGGGACFITMLWMLRKELQNT